MSIIDNPVINKTIPCNKCGQNTDIRLAHELKFHYPSPYEELKGKFCLCETCLGEFMDKFEIPVCFIDYSIFDDIDGISDN